jgi:hypothetical protein
MYWFVAAGHGHHPQGFVTGYDDPDSWKTGFTFCYDLGPFSEAQRNRVPAGVRFAIANSQQALHLIYNSTGYIFLSEPALAVLKSFQVAGYETFALEAKVSSGRATALTSASYHLVNPFREMSVIDVDRSDFYWPDGDRSRSPMFGNERRIMMRGDQMYPDFFADQQFFMREFYFFSDRLKQALCDIGTDPTVFEPCQ